MIAPRATSRSSTRWQCAGLTLIEMIAALIILSSATTTGVSIVQQTSASARAATHRLVAIHVYEQWIIHESLTAGAALPWRWVDDDSGLRWIITNSDTRPAGALFVAPTASPTSLSTTNQPVAVQTPQQQPLMWRTVTVSAEDPSGQLISIAFNRLEPALPAPPRSQPAPGSRKAGS